MSVSSEEQDRTVYLRIRRYDLSENPDVIKKTIEISPLLHYKSVKSFLQELLGVKDDKVIKVRKMDGTLVPLTFLVNSGEEVFSIDVTNITYVDKQTAALLQDAYVDAVKQKIRTLETRIAQSELVIPQLEWRRQAYMEDVMNASLNKMIFLNKRFDELAPQFGPKPPVTMS